MRFLALGALLHLAYLAYASPTKTSINVATMTPLPKHFKYHENNIHFQDFGVRELEHISYKVKDFQIAPYQDPYEHNKVGDVHNDICCGHGYILMFSVGRKGSPLVADWWSKRLKPSLVNFNDSPKKLNFAFEGDMTIIWSSGQSLYLKSMYLGQGHWFTFNNWWIGGPSCNNTGSSCFVRCLGTDANGKGASVDFIRGYGCHPHMDWGNEPDAVLIQNYQSQPNATVY